MTQWSLFLKTAMGLASLGLASCSAMPGAGEAAQRITETGAFADSPYDRARNRALHFGQRYGTAVTKSNSQRLEYEVLTIRGERSDTATWSTIGRYWVRGFDSGAQETDSRACPQVEAVVSNFARLDPPRPRPADLQGRADPVYLEGPPDEPLTGGPSYTVRTAARYENLSYARLEFTAGGGSATDRWFAQALIDLEPCWRNAEEP